MERVLWLVVLVSAGVLGSSNEIPGSSRGIASGDELVAAVVDSCLDGELSVMKCVKLHTLSYLDHLTGEQSRSIEEEKRSLEDGDDRLDDLLLSRVQRFLRDHQFKVQLPEFLFQEATLTFRPAKGLDFDVSFPAAPQGEERAFTEADNLRLSARDMMKEKMLLPLLLLVKLKLKALTPIMVALVSMKALKALILSKISILLVLGFLAAQLFKKAGMMPMMPMMPPMTMEPAAPSTAYGASVPGMGYGAPSGPPPPVTMSSYEPSWEPSPGGPYKRAWEPQQVVYSAYANSPPPAPQAPVTSS